jgi:hypothetical protein
MEQIHELTLEDRRISAKSITEQLGISRDWVGSMIHEDLDMLVACFLPGRAKDLSEQRDTARVCSQFGLQNYISGLSLAIL